MEEKKQLYSSLRTAYLALCLQTAAKTFLLLIWCFAGPCTYLNGDKNTVKCLLGGAEQTHGMRCCPTPGELSVLFVMSQRALEGHLLYQSQICQPSKTMTDLLSDGVCVSHQPLDVVPFRDSLLHDLLDLHLQLSVGPLQRAHLVQVVGQPVVQALHGLLLAGVDADAIEGEAWGQHVESVTQRDGAGQRQPHGDGVFGADTASAVPHRHAGERRLAQWEAAHWQSGRHRGHCREGWTRVVWCSEKKWNLLRIRWKEMTKGFNIWDEKRALNDVIYEEAVCGKQDSKNR